MTERHGVELKPRLVDAEGRQVRFEDGSELEVDAVTWATGYRSDYSWIKLPILGEDGRVRHRRGVTDVPGFYFLGLTWQHTRGSALIGWVKDDAEFIAQEELRRFTGYWWSPDSKSIAFQRTDARAVDTIYVSDPRHPDRAPVSFKYPRAGTTNPTVDLGVVFAAGGEPRWLTWDVTAYPYLARVAWARQGPPTIVVLSREQTELAVIALDGGTPRTLFTEHDDAWINLGGAGEGIGPVAGAPLWLADGNFLWTTEARGDWTLELRGPDGKLGTADDL
jgi:hypothetical protein